MTATTQSSSLNSGLQACLDYLKDCENCATACLSSDMVQMMAECIKRCRDCVDISLLSLLEKSTKLRRFSPRKIKLSTQFDRRGLSVKIAKPIPVA